MRPVASASLAVCSLECGALLPSHRASGVESRCQLSSSVRDNNARFSCLLVQRDDFLRHNGRRKVIEHLRGHRSAFSSNCCALRHGRNSSNGATSSSSSEGLVVELDADTSLFSVREDLAAAPPSQASTAAVAELAQHGGQRRDWLHLGIVPITGFLALIGGYDVEGPESVLAALGVLAAIITVHELGHFLAARWQGIHVTKFALGFGPTLFKWESEGVEYSIRAIPMGGFVAFPDDDPESQYSPSDPNLLKNRPILDRAIVISAGVVANVLFAYTVLFAQASTVGLIENRYGEGVLVPDVVATSAGAKGGLRAGDIVLAVDGKLLPAEAGSVQELVDIIKSSPQRSLAMAVERGDKLVKVVVKPDIGPDGSGRLGVQLTPNAEPIRKIGRTPVESASLAAQEFSRLTGTVTDGLRQILFNFAQTADKISGPVAIVAVGAEVARSDSAALLQFAAIVNLNLAVVNILPLPALDGGYLFLLFLEALRGGKKLPDRLEQGIMSSGILFLLALGVVLMVRDTLNLGIVQQMMQ